MKTILIFLAIIIAGLTGFFYYQKNNSQNPDLKYPELKPWIIAEMGGQEIVDGLIEKYEENKQQLEQAIQDYELSEKQEEKKPRIEYLIEAATYARYIKKYDEAIEILNNQVFKYYEKSDIALINLAHIYEEMGENQKAIDIYLRFYKTFDAGPEQFHKEIIYNYMALDNKAKVREYYEEYKKEGMKSEEIEQWLFKD